MIVDENGMCTLSEEDCSYHSHTAKRTNADKIRSMSDEELAELWWKRMDCGECPMHKDCMTIERKCKELALDWLKQEVASNG